MSFPRQLLSAVGILTALCFKTAAFVVPAVRLASISCSAGGEAAATSLESTVEVDTVLPQALIFDCDGVLADTERDGHRPAFNAAFKIKNLGERVVFARSMWIMMMSSPT